jgi:hypothetical protein
MVQISSDGSSLASTGASQPADRKQIYHVGPARAADLQDEFFKLSSNDYLPTPAIFVPIVLYLPVVDAQQVLVAQQLRSGLEESLRLCRHMVGTIEKNDDGDYGILSWKDSYVLFIENWTDRSQTPSYEDLAKADFVGTKLGNLKRWGVEGMDYDPLDSRAAVERSPPVFAVQANFVKDGLVLSLPLHHSVMDFAGLASFVHVWAKCTRALVTGGPMPQVDAACSMRSGLDYDLRAPEDTKNHVRVDSGVQQQPKKVVNAAEVLASMPNFLPYSLCLFHLPESKIASLKALATPASGPWISSYDACAALWFKILTRYRAKAYKADTSLAAPFSELVNIRSKMTPPLPAGYFGNAIIPVGSNTQLVQLSIKEISEDASLATIASYIRRMTNSIDDAYIWKILGDVVSMRKSDVRPKFKMGAIPILKTTDWRAPNIYEADFGFATSEAMRTLMGATLSVTMLPMRQSRDGGEKMMEFVVPVEAESVEELLADPEVKAWFSFKGFEHKA